MGGCITIPCLLPTSPLPFIKMLRIPVLLLFASLMGGSGDPVAPLAAPDPGNVDGDQIRIEVVPLGPDQEEIDSFMDDLKDGALAPLAGSNWRLLRFRFTPHEKGVPEIGTPFRAEGFDYDGSFGFALTGDMENPADVVFQILDGQPRPSVDEFLAAVETVSADPDLGPMIRSGDYQPVRPMPELFYDPSRPGDRVIGVGIIPLKDGLDPVTVGVNFSSNLLVHYAPASPYFPLASSACNPPPSAGGSGGGSGSASVTIFLGNTEIWAFKMTRPAASSGTWGSGIDLEDVRFRGKNVLNQAHVPINCVLYDNNACGPYRDWQDEENAFQASGRDLASGIRHAFGGASTVLDSQNDSGNFHGVAVYRDGNEVVLKSECSAGWYRYCPQWRFGVDGTIKAWWGFEAVQNSCTCRAHTHHCYFRFDFNLGDGTNSFYEYNGSMGNWTSTHLATEQSRDRNAATFRHWRVTDPDSGDTYAIAPGDFFGHHVDGEVDSYGEGDTWFLQYKSNQIDDSGQGWGTGPHLDNFINGESVDNTDVVMWYGNHFRHDHNDPNFNATKIVGPRLIPLVW